MLDSTAEFAWKTRDVGNLVVHDVKAQVHDVKAEVHDAKEEVRAVKEGVRAVKEEVRAVKEEVRAVKEEVRDVKAKVCDVKEEVCDVKAEVCDVKEEVRAVNEDVHDVKEEVRDVKAKVGDVKPKVDDVKAKVDDVNLIGNVDTVLRRCQRPLGLAAEGAANLVDRREGVSLDEVGCEPEEANAVGCFDARLPRRIALGRAGLCVNSSVDLDDQPRASSVEVDDPARREGMLPSKPHAEPPATKLSPEEGFTPLRLPPHLPSKPNERKQ